jgi:hypothetical protein
MNYAEIIFRAVDRIGLITCAPVLNYAQLGQAVDFLVVVTSPLIKKTKKKGAEVIIPSRKELGESEYYDRALNFVAEVMRLLEGADILLRRKSMGEVLQLDKA